MKMKKIVTLIAVIVCANVFACTSWMIFSDLTENGTNILHKNRDANPRGINAYLSDASSPRKWIASGDKGGIRMGMNVSGLAVVANNGEDYTGKKEIKLPKFAPTIQECLETFDTAEQCVEYLLNIIKNKLYCHRENRGMIYFFCDRNEGYICEITPYFCSVQRYTNGYAVRANIWQNPGMYQLSRSNIKWYLNSSARAYIAISELNKAIDRHSKITLTDIFALTRHYNMPETSPQKRSVCFRATNSTASFEIDRRYPDVLSTMYTTIGHPRHTVYVPVPVCVEKLHPAMTDLRWSAAAWKRFDELKLEAPIPAEWTKFEADSMVKYNKAKDEARKLLDAGKRAEAVKLMNSTAEKIWNDAEKLLNI